MDNTNRALTTALLSSLLSELLLLLLFISGDHLSPTTKRHRSPSPESAGAPPSKHPRSAGEPDSAIPTTPDSFTLCFNMNSSTFEWLSSLLEPLLECRDPVHSPLNLPVQTRLGVGLFRLATASDYPEISRRFNVSVPVAKFCVNQLCRVLCTNFRFWVGFPASNELEPIVESFESLTGLPNCCGVMHCTRFMVLKKGPGDEPEHEHEHEYEPIAAQIVSDSSSKILSIVAGFNGKKGNQLILKSSSLYDDIESNRLLNSSPVDVNGVSVPQYLIGEQGYSVLPWLMVPFDQPEANSCEENFNSAHDLMMVSGFKTVDSLKKWGVLSRPIEVEIKTMVAYIGACSILHNALLTREDYSCLSDKSDECLRVSRRSEHHIGVDVSLEDDSIEQKGFEIRNALATRARRCE